MKSKKWLYGLVIAFVVMAGVLTGVGLGKHYVANAQVDYVAHTSDTSGTYDYFSSSDNWLVSLGWANNSSVTSFSSLTYTGNTLYYQTKFFVGNASSEDNPNIMLWGVGLTGSTDKPTGSTANPTNYHVYDLTSVYGVYATQTLGWNYTSDYDYSAYTYIYGLRFRSSQNTSRYNIVYFQALSYSDSTTLPRMTFKMGSVEMGNYTYSPYAPQGSDSLYPTNVSSAPSYIRNGYYNWVSYLSLDGNYRYTFFIPTFYDTTNDTYANAPYNYFSYRRYILQSEDLSDNAYYQQGYTDGKNVGTHEGYDDGYDTGYNDGYSTGDSSGYNRGVEDANTYSFLGLMGSIVDAPISAFRGLFDFTILGINMADFLASLFTLCIIFLVVKFVFLK